MTLRNYLLGMTGSSSLNLLLTFLILTSPTIIEYLIVGLGTAGIYTLLALIDKIKEKKSV